MKFSENVQIQVPWYAFSCSPRQRGSKNCYIIKKPWLIKLVNVPKHYKHVKRHEPHLRIYYAWKKKEKKTKHTSYIRILITNTLVKRKYTPQAIRWKAWPPVQYHLLSYKQENFYGRILFSTIQLHSAIYYGVNSLTIRKHAHKSCVYNFFFNNGTFPSHRYRIWHFKGRSLPPGFFCLSRPRRSF